MICFALICFSFFVTRTQAEQNSVFLECLPVSEWLSLIAKHISWILHNQLCSWSGVVGHMPWTPLTERFSSLPLILAGPMLRRTEPHAVTVWLALKASQQVTLRIYRSNAEGKLVQQLEGTRQTVRLGDHLHIVAVTARTTNEHERLAWGELYYYNLFFQSERATGSNASETLADLNTPG